MAPRPSPNTPSEMAASFTAWLSAGREFCDQSELDELRAKVVARQRAFIAALEDPTDGGNDTIPRKSTRYALKSGGRKTPTAKVTPEARAKSGTKPTTSACVLDALRAHPNATGHDLVGHVQKLQHGLPGPSIHAAIFRLVESGAIAKSGERGSYRYALKVGADV